MFYSSIAGIQEPNFYGSRRFEPGYSRIGIKPHVLGDLTHASASIRTVRGIISSSWRKNGNSLTLEVALPAGSRAKVSVPKIGLKNVTVTENGKSVYRAGRFVKGVAGISSAEESEDYVTFDVGSGSYMFKLVGSI